MIETAEQLSPIYFAMVMATGIISTASQLLGFALLATALFWLNVGTYLLVWVATIIRVALRPRHVGSDLIDHRSGPVFFTSVAATCILGSQCIVVLHNYPLAIFLWSLAIALWVVLTYTVFAGMTVKEHKPTLNTGINGAWLLAVVATQAIAFLSALIAPHWPQPYRMETNFLALSMWLWGGMLYIWMISLIFYRYTFFEFSPADLTPPYWINMGAMAISTLSGSLLVINIPQAPFIQSLLPFLKGFTVFFWASGTWWIPMLAILGVWRHGYKRFPLRYDPQYWGAVFPLGMYTVATFRMAEALKLNFLFPVPLVGFYVALAAWLTVFCGLLHKLVIGLVKER